MTHRFFSPFPKHLQIRELLLRRLEREFEIGDQFPTEQTLAEEFGVTRKTIRESLGWLEKEGLIRRHRGQGTFVKAKPRLRADKRVTGMTEHFAELKLDTHAELIEQGLVKPPLEISAALRRPDDEPMFRVARVRHFENQPLAFHECFVVLEYGARALRVEFDQGSLMRELESTLGVQFWENHQQIEAVTADTTMATHLDVSLGAPLLAITRHYTVEGGGPAVIFRSHFRADRYYYTVDLNQPRPEDDGCGAEGEVSPERPSRKVG